MASENHYLLRFFVSRNPKWVALKIVPILVLYFTIIFKNEVSIYTIIALFLGVFIWSFFEYFVHKIGYHKRTKNKKIQWYLDAFHLHHHKNLKDYSVLNAGFLLIYPLTIIILSLVYFLIKDIVLVAYFGLGMTLYYLFYEYIHYQIHKKIHLFGYLKMIQKYHLHHHYINWNKNFGNTITIWDRVFKTYDASYKEFNLTNKQREDLILKS